MQTLGLLLFSLRLHHTQTHTNTHNHIQCARVSHTAVYTEVRLHNLLESEQIQGVANLHTDFRQILISAGKTAHIHTTRLESHAT